MRVGDKVFSISKNRDVIILDFTPGCRAIVYDERTSTQSTLPQGDLLEYNTPKTATRSAVHCGTSAKTIKNEKKEGIGMNVRSLVGQFGRVANGECAVTFGGQVVVRRGAGEYVCYDAEKGQIVNHLELVIKEASKFIFVLPVTAVTAGDVIRVKNTYFQVLEQKEDGSIVGINLNTGAKSTQCKETNAFGINFYYKVTSLFNAQAGEGAQAGAFNPLMLMALGDGGSDDLLPLLLAQGGFGGDATAQNQLLPLLLMGDKLGSGSDIKDLLMIQALSGQTAGAGAINPLMFLALGK